MIYYINQSSRLVFTSVRSNLIGLFLGLSDHKSPGNQVWDDGSTSPFRLWEVGMEFNEQHEEHCAWKKTGDTFWRRHRCGPDVKYKAMCQVKCK